MKIFIFDCSSVSHNPVLIITEIDDSSTEVVLDSLRRNESLLVKQIAGKKRVLAHAERQNSTVSETSSTPYHSHSVIYYLPPCALFNNFTATGMTGA